MCTRLSQLIVVIFNCHGLKSSVNYIRILCDRYDIILLQETWLLPYKLPLLKKIHPVFHGDGISAIDTESGILIGRSYGGFAVLWIKTLNIDMNIIKYEDDKRLMGIHIKSTKQDVF